MKMKSKVTAQPVSKARSASSGTPYTAGQESGGSTSEVVSVVGLDGTLSAPPVEDQESSQSSATRVSIEGGNSVNNLMSDASVSDKRPEVIAKTPLFSFKDKEKMQS